MGQKIFILVMGATLLVLWLLNFVVTSRRGGRKK